MFVINVEDNSIHATRGDIVFFSVTAADNGVPYTFQYGDIVRIAVCRKKNSGDVLMQKDFHIVAEADSVQIFLDKDDTKFGDLISKPTDYWYEVTLNPDTDPQTIIGYDTEGARVFRLYPEVGDRKDDVE